MKWIPVTRPMMPFVCQLKHRKHWVEETVGNPMLGIQSVECKKCGARDVVDGMDAIPDAIFFSVLFVIGFIIYLIIK